ncbi:MAG: hypothetical protein RQ952_03145 [Thermoproteota archaeon]|jgi:predicted nucleotidyltransferase|nr:hypothetical protein [Thermoproteota archaeon]
MNGLLRDKDFIKCGNIFSQVIGYLHPKDYVIAIPRYVKVDYATIWRDHSYYDRALKEYSSSELRRTLSKYYSKYLRYDTNMDSILPLIAHKEIDKIFLTSKGFDYLTRENSLAKRAYEILDLLSNNANIPKYEFGLTGTLLVGIYNVIYSDIDIVVYGKNNVEKIKDFLKERKEFLIKDSEIIKGLDKKSYSIISKRKWNKCIYKNRHFSINPVLKFDEVKISYDEVKIKNLGIIETKVEIIEKLDPYFYPLRYKIKPYETKYEIKELVIFENYYLDAFEEGDKVQIKAILQKYREKDDEYFRLAYGVREIEDQYLRILA